MNRITADTLTDRHACDEQVDEFRNRFPNGVTFKSEDDAITQCVAAARVFEWRWAADALLDTPAWEAYRDAKATAWSAYLETMATARKAYMEAETTAWKACKESKATAWEAYGDAKAAAWEAFDEAKATAFARAFWGMEG